MHNLPIMHKPCQDDAKPFNSLSTVAVWASGSSGVAPGLSQSFAVSGAFDASSKAMAPRRSTYHILCYHILCSSYGAHASPQKILPTVAMLLDSFTLLDSVDCWNLVCGLSRKWLTQTVICFDSTPTGYWRRRLTRRLVLEISLYWI